MKIALINKEPDKVYRFAYGDDEVQVGSFALHYNQANNGFEWFLWSVEIYEAFKGLGHGHEMVKLAMVETKRRGATILSLYVKADNEVAISLYKKLGFVSKLAWGYPRNIMRMEVTL